MPARTDRGVSFRPFTEDRLADAARLLAARELRTPSAGGTLSVAAARALLDAQWRHPRTAGHLAVRGARVVGFLLYYLVADDVSGRIARVAPFGHALAASESDELYRDLYAAAAATWAARGYYAHYAQLPASATSAIAAWHALGFGLDQLQAVIPLAPKRRIAPARPDAAVTIQRATPADLATMVSLAGLVFEAQARSPTFNPFFPEDREDWAVDYGAMLADDHTRIWLARVRGKPAGFALFRPFVPTALSLQSPPDTIEVLLLAVASGHRRKALGRALLARGLDDARARGFAHCAAYWRAQNLTASRFWPRMGFSPAVVRVARLVDPRIAWATG